MAITYYASRGYNNRTQSNSVLNNPTGITYSATRGNSVISNSSKKEEEEQNVGGLIGGLGYLLEKTAVGFVSSLEGITDYTFSGLAKLFGNDAWAEEIIRDDWFGDWYSHPEEWYNPSEGWQVAGDVAGGIGTSLPSMAAAVGLTVATAGMAAPAAAAIVGGGSFLTSGLGAAGRATKEAYEQTGQLTGKEYGYGALVGATEGGVEALGNLLSLGSGAVVKSVSKAIGKETAEAFAKQGIIKTLGASFAGEAFEEGLSEILTPYWQRATYDPNAKNATAEEILYSSLVGGLSGLVMGGSGHVIESGTNLYKGNKLTLEGRDSQVLETSGFFSAFEDANQSGDELFSEISSKRKSLLESLQQTGGKVVTLQQKRDLGALERANVAGSMKLFVAKRAQNIVNNAETIAEKLTAYGYKTADGKPITFTAAEITEGYDPKKPSSIYKALKSNSKLRELAVTDATGQLMMDTNKFAKNTLMGEKLASQVDINRFYEQATREELQAVSNALKIESWASLTPEILNQKITDFLNDGGVDQAIEANERRAAFTSFNGETIQRVPKYAGMAQDGMMRYSDGQLDLGIERKGDSYRTYNYKTGDLSNKLTQKELNSFLRDYDARKTEYATAERQRMEAEQKRKNEIAEIDNLARENIKDYKSLNAPNQSMIRRLIREGRAKGVSDSDLLMYAKVSAHSGIDIQFDKEATYRGTKEDGSADYADGFYEASKNRIVVNPEGKRTAEKLLIHELDHAIRKYVDKTGKQSTRIYLDAIEGVDQATRDKILGTYKKTARPGEVAAVVMDETNAYYAEQVLGNKYTLEKLLEAEPTLKDKILSFFKGASTDYADVPKLSNAAKKYYRTYKKLFDEFSAHNAENNALENAHLGSNFEKNTQNISITGANSDKQYAFAGVNADTADKMKLATAEQMLKDGANSETVRQETGWFKGYDGKWRFEIDDSKLKITIPHSRYTKLSDILKHDTLFEAYPELKEIYVTMDDIESGKGSYSRTFGDITISRDLMDNPEGFKKVLMHEVQHAIQDIEQFERGASVEFWDKKLKEGYDSRQDFAKNKEKGLLEQMKEIRMNDREFLDDMELLETFKPDHPRGKIDWDTLEQIEEDSPAWKNYDRRRDALEEKYGADKVFKFLSLSSALERVRHEGERYAPDLYLDTAGEIEARDVENRLDMSGEQRKNTRPDIDRTDVVFADGSNVSYFAKGEYDSETAGIKDQIRNSQDILNKMDVVYSGTVPTRFENRLQSKKWAVEELSKRGFKADRQGFGVIEFSEKDIYGALDHLDSDEERAAIAAIYHVLKRGIQIGEHGNHKLRQKHTVTFAAPVEINGVRANMAAVVNMRNKKYYVHRIIMPDGSSFKFSENKNANQEAQRGVPKGSLANATRSASIDSITENAEKVKRIYEKIKSAYPEIEKTLTEGQATSLIGRGIEGDNLLNASDLAETILLVGGEITPDASVIVYHGTSKENAEKINRTGKMYGKEDGLFFSTRGDGLVLDYGKAVVKAEIPLEKLILDDIFDSEVHLRLPVRRNAFTDIRIVKPETDVATASGKQYALDIDSDSGNISGAEVMSWLNNKPEIDGKLDLEATVARGLPYKRGKSDLTVGEIRKVIANTTHEKVYSKSDALKAVNKLSGTWGLTVKARDEIADTVWQFLNESPDIEYRQDMAHDIAEYIVAKVLMDSKTENPDALEAAERLSYLRTGIGKLSFSDPDIAELKHAADEKGFKRLMGRWGFKGTKKAEGVSGGYVATRRIPMDVFVTSVAREMPGMEHLEDMHPAEAFLEIDKAYSRAYADSKDKWISSYWDMPDSEIPSMIKEVEEGIMSAFDVFGEKSKFKKQVEAKIESYQKRAEKFKAERDEIKGRDRILGLLMNQATKMKNLKMGTYANATQHDSDVLRGSVERLARIQFRGNLNVSGTRQIISELRLWYTPKNSMLEYVDEQNPGYYNRGISDMLDALADGEGGFDKTDLMMLYDVMAYFTNFVENYGKVWRKGQWVDAEIEAKRYVNTLQTNSELKVSPVSRLIGSRYMQTFGDPMTVARRMDMYDSGFFTEMLEELREGAMGAQIAEMEILSDYDKFLTDNRKYIERAATERIIYQGVEVPKMQLIGLYMTLKRRHSRPGLAQNGFSFVDTDGKKVRVNGFALDVKDITEAEIDKRSEEQIALIDSKLTDTDRQYIKILEKAYNEDARRLKADRDIQRLGFTNAGMGYYYPIRRGNIAKNIDSSDYMAELDRVSNSSFNKNTVKGARQELYIENADVVFRRHVRAVTQYSYMSPAIEAYNRLYNLDVGGNPNHPISVATESANVWDRGNAYFKKLIADIQGIPATSGEGEEILSKIRGGYAKYQLGANPKVWFTQLSSLFASTSKLDADSIMKGASVSAEGLDKYCPLAKLRSSENTAAIAQAVLDTRGKRAASGISRVSDALMAPIGKMDRFVVGRLFASCQVQIEKDGGAKVGTEQNKIAAGELLTQVILETQQNSIATERSAAMRSGSEIIRTATMFTSDSMKVTGRVVDAYGEALSLKAKIKAESDTTKRTELEKRLKTANTKVNKSLGAMVGSAVYMACVAQLFRWLYNKDEDEDKTTFETMFFDTLGNMLGGLPFVKDVYSKLFEGYDVDNYAYSAINDLISSAGSFMELGSKAITGDLTAEERNRGIRNLANSIGQVTGMPTRNIYNVLYGMTKRFSPTSAFVVDSWFYEKNYQNELNKAIERGDNKTASYILSVIMGERFDENIDETVFNEILNLTAAGYKVLPKLMPDSISLGDVEYPLSDGEREAMRKVYSESEQAIKALVESSYYSSFTDEEKAKAIDYISDLYYDKARNEVLGTESGKAVTILKAVSADKLAAYYVKTRGIQSDVDAQGNTISGSKRVKVVQAIGALGVSTDERLLLICASGYALKDGDARGLSAEGAKKRLLKYILKYNGLRGDERLALAEMCGFEVRNGRIVNNFSSKLQPISGKSSKGK